MEGGFIVGKYETPDYDVIFKEEDYEIRKYFGFSIVEYENKEGNMSGFRTLFNYISDDNKENQKISMTTPVIQDVAKDDNKMAFVVPKKFADQIPEPNNPNLKVKKFDQGLFAVIRYSGASNRNKEVKMNKKLEDWINRNGYEKESEYILAFYNPPFVPGVFKRNEIWIRVTKKS